MRANYTSITDGACFDPVSITAQLLLVLWLLPMATDYSWSGSETTV